MTYKPQIEFINQFVFKTTLKVTCQIYVTASSVKNSAVMHGVTNV